MGEMGPQDNVVPLRQPGDDSDVVEEYEPPTEGDWLRRDLVAAAERGDAAEAIRVATELQSRLASAPRFRTIGPAEIFAPLPPLPWVVRELGIAPGRITLLAGYGGSGKTVAAQSMALSIATGKPIWDSLPCEPGRVVHVDYEQGEWLDRYRYRRLARAMGHDLDELMAGDQSVLRMEAFPGVALAEELERAWVEVCTGCTLCIVDSFRAAAAHVDENDSKARLPLDMLTRVSERTGCAILVLHHARKTPTGPSSATPQQEGVRGSGGLFDAAGSVLVAVGADGATPIVHHVKASITGKHAEPFALEIVDIPNGDDPDWGLKVLKTDPADLTLRRGEKADDELAEKIIAFVKKNPRCTTRELLHGVKGHSHSAKTAMRDRLVRLGRLENIGGRSGDSWVIPAEVTDG
jgi:KaiC/GvpD/RAD55 family RecA-like ATPase